ncbi:MAG: hypothetical protein QOJ29_4110, partial [Thermoleophilaceae bacterium]|nr:hypothetical protein [Thermoleophilaceae bacterium]
SAIAKPPIATAIAATPAAMDALSLWRFKVVCVRVTVVHLPLWVGGDPTMRRESQSSV